jgi:hypothetical protein
MPKRNSHSTSSPRHSSPTKLNPILDRHVLAYAAAAGAAGVAVLALGQPSRAEVVYTPAKTPLFDGYLYLDLNHDGITDFTFFGRIRSCTSGCRYGPYTSFLVQPAQATNGVETYANSYHWASRLNAHKEVGPKGRFQQGTGSIRMADGHGGGFSCGDVGPWENARGYLALEFSITGQLHYGWARVSCLGNPKRFLLLGYAYETIPGRPILAGVTSGTDEADNGSEASAKDSTQGGTLGWLAQGALVGGTPGKGSAAPNK